MILIGCVIYAASVVLIHPVQIIPGSMLGVAVICATLLHTPTGLVNLLLNIPIMAAGTKFLGKRVLVYTIFTLLGTSSLIDLWSGYARLIPAWHPVVIAILGGVLMGVDTGILLRAGATMGGTTALDRLLQLRCPALRIGNALLGDRLAFFYSIVYTFFCMKTIDLLLYGLRKKQRIR